MEGRHLGVRPSFHDPGRRARLIARRQRGGLVLVVPHGTGIGDLVNLRPLLGAIADRHPASRIHVLCDPALDWLLPPGIVAIPSVHGVRPWRRLRRDGIAAVALGRLSVPTASRLLGPLVNPRTARWMTGYLRRQEFPVVINLLEMLGDGDVGARWTRRPGQPDAVHVIDLLAAALARRGIAVPPGRRAPRLDVDPAGDGAAGEVLLNPGSGSTLKEAPARLWREVIAGLESAGMRPRLVLPPGGRHPNGLEGIPAGIPLRAPLPELARRLAAAPVVISPDTGILHIAAAIGTPYVGLFGATDPRFCGPYPGGPGIILEAPVEHPPLCGGCWRAQMLPSARCPLHTPDSCLASIPAAAVIAAAQSVARPIAR